MTMTKTPLIRPAWTPLTTVSMVVGFMIYWPIGLAVLAYIMWGDRLEGFTRDVNRVTDGFVANCKRASCSGAGRSGNVAFDEWRDAELERLAAERRRLDSMREEFDTYVRELRRAKDQDEFNRFMGERAEAKRAAKDGGRGPGVTINA